jgi:hypothetical protein
MAAELGEFLRQLDERGLGKAARQLALQGFPALHEAIEFFGGYGDHGRRIPGGEH